VREDADMDKRKLIIDTDTGSDDAVAIVMALREPSVEVLACTTVSGNVEMEKATVNCLQSIEYAGTYRPPVYRGCRLPLMCPYESATQVHGEDGMGDCPWLKKPSIKAFEGNAVDKMLDIIRSGDGDIEILALGPLTNIACAIIEDRETMMRVPRITIMGGAWYYDNPHTVAAEFNVMCDPEAADIVFSSGIPFTLVTLEACWGDMKFSPDDLSRFRSAGELGKFCMDCNRTLIDMNRRYFGREELDLPDPAAFAALAKPEMIKEKFPAYTRVELTGKYMRGATIFLSPEKDFADDAFGIKRKPANSVVVTAMDGPAFKDYMYSLITVKY
jgi:purine nucleosidase